MVKMHYLDSIIQAHLSIVLDLMRQHTYPLVLQYQVFADRNYQVCLLSSCPTERLDILEVVLKERKVDADLIQVDLIPVDFHHYKDHILMEIKLNFQLHD
jgi:septum formation topological specificity factor MinE